MPNLMLVNWGGGGLPFCSLPIPVQLALEETALVA